MKDLISETTCTGIAIAMGRAAPMAESFSSVLAFDVAKAQHLKTVLLVLHRIRLDTPKNFDPTHFTLLALGDRLTLCQIDVETECYRRPKP